MAGSLVSRRGGEDTACSTLMVELRAGLQGRGGRDALGPEGGAPGSLSLRVCDADGDSALTYAEFAGCVQREMAALRTDRGEAIGVPCLEKFATKADKNSDLMVDEEELVTWATKFNAFIWSEYDENYDYEYEYDDYDEYDDSEYFDWEYDDSEYDDLEYDDSEYDDSEYDDSDHDNGR
ncbi:uncharacterized protein LOC108682100 isoform X2 [Hyalella azteca]|uniref:Uncharacterized protein LOC108682100 isoform X2 n=1 Tax=Hyalella azteca TaxID=294128 RepID=A0A979FQY0_HYAAZ|nr:uncharacterized protein LOC108682100 isoform X2 [Hyalella azteca]